MNDSCTYWCDFCDALESTGDIGKTAEFERCLGNVLASRTIFETERFAVIATLGQIVEGYLLLLSKAHYPSMAHLPVELYEELESVYCRTRSLLSREYARTIIFEHGPMPITAAYRAPARGGGSCVDHAHFHFVPVSCAIDLLPSLREKYSSRVVVALRDLRAQASRITPYFFLETLEGEQYVFDAQVAPPQYMRRLLANATGNPERWNWRTCPETERVVRTVQLLGGHSSGED